MAKTRFHGGAFVLARGTELLADRAHTRGFIVQGFNGVGLRRFVGGVNIYGRPSAARWPARRAMVGFSTWAWRGQV